MNLGQAKKVLNNNKIQNIITPTEAGKVPWKFTSTVHSENGRPWKIEAKDAQGNDAGYVLISDFGNKQYLFNTAFVKEGSRRKGLTSSFIDKAKADINEYDGGKLYIDKREATPAGRAFVDSLDKKGLLGENTRIPGHGTVTEYKGKSELPNLTLKSLIPIAAGASLYSPQAAQAKKYKQMESDQALQDAYSPVDMIIAGATGGATMGLRAISALADPVINYAIDRMLGD
jgi:hypothetical protein